MRRWWPLCNKCKLEVVSDAIDHRIVGYEGDDAHFCLAFGTGHGINFVDLADHLCPAAARVAAVKIALNDFFDDRPEETVLSLEVLLILGQELVKVMEEDPVEHGTFRMTGPVHP